MSLQLARAVLDEDHAKARQLAMEIVEAEVKAQAEQSKRDKAASLEEKKRAEFRAEYLRLLESYNRPLRKQFSEAGRHLGNNGFRWGLALKNAGLAIPGVGGHNRETVMEELVKRCLGRIDHSVMVSHHTVLHKPDQTFVDHICVAIRNTSDANGLDRDGNRVVEED